MVTTRGESNSLSVVSTIETEKVIAVEITFNFVHACRYFFDAYHSNKIPNTLGNPASLSHLRNLSSSSCRERAEDSEVKEVHFGSGCLVLYLASLQRLRSHSRLMVIPALNPRGLKYPSFRGRYTLNRQVSNCETGTGFLSFVF